MCVQGSDALNAFCRHNHVALASSGNGSLSGLTFAVKDIFDVAGHRTGFGHPDWLTSHPPAQRTAPVIARLLEVGARMIGRTHCDELCYSLTGENVHYGMPVNVNAPGRIPGGSSSGSAAAVADGMVPLAFGTQTAGSVIRPGAYCNCVAYKPSFGLINRAGVKPLADSLDTIGVFARSIEDAAFFAGVLSERPPLRHLSTQQQAPRFGLYRTPMWDRAEPATAAALDAARTALERAGAAVMELAIAPEHEGLSEAQDTIMWFETVRALAYERIEHSAELSPRLAQQIDTGMAIGAETYDQARIRTLAARAGLEAFFGPCDAILAPAAPGEAPAGLGNTGDPIFNRMWTLLGLPCATLPARWADNGLPTGVQIVGRVHDDAKLMACAFFLEQALTRLA